MKCSKKGDRRGVIISVFVSYERYKLRDDDDTRSTSILPIPASLVYYVHTMVIFGTLVGFLAAMVRKCSSIR